MTVRFISIPVMLLVISLSAAAQSERSLVRQGNSAYKKAEYADAEIHYRKALDVNREMHEGMFNLGDALYRQGRFTEAADQFRAAATRIDDPIIKAQAFHNLGNALLQAQKVAESIDAYKEALKLNPRDMDTKYNLEYARMLLNRQQQQNQNQKEDKQKQDQEESGQERPSEENQSDGQKQQARPKDAVGQAEQQKRDEKRGTQQENEYISKEDAERILEALKNKELQVQRKLQIKAPVRAKTEKDW